MKSRLYIGGVNVDLFDDVPITINYSVTDITEPASRTVSYTKTIELPNTPNNAQIFKQLFVINKDNTINSFDPNLRVVAFVQNGTSTLIEGFFQLTNIVKLGNDIKYEGVIYSEGKSLFSQMGDSFITGNPNSANDVSLESGTPITVGCDSDGGKINANNFVASSRVAERFYVDSGNTSELTTYPFWRVPFNNQRLAVKCRHIWDSIFTKYGQVYQSTFISANAFSKFVYMDSKKDLPTLTTTQYNNISAKVSRTTNTGYIFNNAAYSIIVCNNDVLDPDNRYNNTTGVFTCNSFRSYDVNAKVSIQSRLNVVSTTTFTNQTFSITIFVRAYADGVAFPTTLNIVQTFTLNGTYTAGQTIDFTYTSATGDLIYDYKDYFVAASNSTIDLRMTVAASLPATLTASAQVLSGSTLSITPHKNTLALGDTYTIANAMSNKHKQKDFIVDMLRLFNMYMFFDGTKYIVEPRDTFYSLGNVIDWTTKIDRSQAVEIIPVGQLTWKELNLKFQDDADYYSKLYKQVYSEVYGQQDVINNNEFIKETKEVEVSSSAPITVSTAINRPKTQHLYDVNNGNFEPVDCKHRYGIWGGWLEEGTVFWQWYFSDSNLINSSGYTYVGEFNNPTNATESTLFGLPSQIYYQAATVTLNANSGLYDNYYNNELNNQISANAKLIRCSVFLTPQDINNLKLYDTVIVDGVQCLIGKISDYDTNNIQPTQVELIQYVQ